LNDFSTGGRPAAIAVRDGEFDAAFLPEGLPGHPARKVRRLLGLLCGPKECGDAMRNLPQARALKAALRQMRGARARQLESARDAERRLRADIPADKARSRKPEWVEARSHNRALRDAVKRAAEEAGQAGGLCRMLREALARSRWEEMRKEAEQNEQG